MLTVRLKPIFLQYKKKNAKPFDLTLLPGVLPPGAASFMIVFVRRTVCMKIAQNTCRSTGKTVIIITHNSALTQIADRVIHVKNGKAIRVQENAAPMDVERIEW